MERMNRGSCAKTYGSMPESACHELKAPRRARFGTHGVRRRLIILAVVCACSQFWFGLLQAAEWSAPLEGGGEVAVDPRTNRATVRKDGVETQLWDGVHRLEDGSVITVESGQVVPNEDILRARVKPELPERADQPGAATWIGAPIVGASPCEALVNRVCGENDLCAGQTGCSAARQLLDMERQERTASGTPNRMTYSSGQCQEADRDRSFFPSCSGQPAAPARSEASVSSVPPSSCQSLVDKVCGSQGACAGQTACDAARQLLNMAQEEARQGAGSTAASSEPTSERQCAEALGDEGFFRRCPGN
jgi:hypothetical protein